MGAGANDAQKEKEARRERGGDLRLETEGEELGDSGERSGGCKARPRRNEGQRESSEGAREETELKNPYQGTP